MKTMIPIYISKEGYYLESVVLPFLLVHYRSKNVGTDLAVHKYILVILRIVFT